LAASIFSLAHVLVGEPASTPDRVRGRLSPEHALAALVMQFPFPSLPHSWPLATPSRCTNVRLLSCLIDASARRNEKRRRYAAFVYLKSMRGMNAPPRGACGSPVSPAAR
jgi:hypothetical protein